MDEREYFTLARDAEISAKDKLVLAERRLASIKSELSKLQGVRDVAFQEWSVSMFQLYDMAERWKLERSTLKNSNTD